MKPQIILQDSAVGGFHNGDLKRTRSRLDSAKSWKRQRVIMLIPAGENVPVKVYLAHSNLCYPPNNGVARIAAVGLEVGEAYSTSIEGILAHPELSQWEYLLTIEHDNLPPPDGVIRLIERMENNPRFDCIGGLYFTKGEGGVAQIWGDPKDPVLNFRPQLPDPNGGLVECNGTGMGFNIWRLKMFKDKKLRRPWFVTQKKDGVSTQDLYFWSDAKKWGVSVRGGLQRKGGPLGLVDRHDLVKIDLGAGLGKNTPEGFEAVDLVKSKGVRQVDLTQRWPWKSNSVDEARCVYVVHYLTPDQRIHWANELFRVLKPGAKCEVHTPHPFAARAYGDVRAQWPPVSEWWYLFLNKGWREAQNETIPGYQCDFDYGIGYGMHQLLIPRNQEFQQNAMTFYKEAAQDLITTLTKRGT